ncbi:hypothetical protein ACFTWF_41375 [Rhodococcus sp. NPDC056960]|uniref:hypothetical protein n=1 Tax=Rhodococcus sp. NPDC056960 TaxID=3345982 RepID=UPI00363588AB
MTEDSQQISVSELLKRNGQQVESRGGRRRRGVKGGISVAELTGEIPVVRDSSESRALEPEAEPEPAPPAAPEPAQKPAPAARPARADERTAAFTAPVDEDDDEDDDEPIASRPAGRGRGVVSGGTSRDHQGTWVSRAARPQPPTPEAAPSTPVATAATPVVKKPEPAPTVAAPRVKPAPKTDSPAPAEPVKSAAPTKPPAPTKPATPTKPAVPAKPAAQAKPATPPMPGATAKPGTAAPANGATKVATAPKPDGPAKVEPEPALLSGSTLAGDLMRQSRDKDAANAAEETDLLEATPDKAETGAPETDTPESPRRSRKEAKAEKAEAAKAEKAGKGEGAENSTREWAVLIGQGVVAVIAGALLFKGFEKLWDVFPWVALILALLVIVGLVAMVRILRRTDDITSFVIAVVVGMIVTLGPLAFMLASG